MKNISDISLVFSALFLLNGQLGAAALDKDTRNILNAEAASTSMENAIPDGKLAPEPSVFPNDSLDYQALEANITSQIKQALTTEPKANKAPETNRQELANALESVVSTALLKGNKLEDIRSAVAAAMIDLKQGNEAESAIPAEKIQSAASALQEIVSESTVTTDETVQDAYIASLKAELNEAAPQPAEADNLDQAATEASMVASKEPVEVTIEPAKSSGEQTVPDVAQAAAVVEPEKSTPNTTNTTPSTMSAVDTILAAMSSQTIQQSTTVPSVALADNAPEQQNPLNDEEEKDQEDVIVQAKLEPETESESASEPAPSSVATSESTQTPAESISTSEDIVMVIKEESSESDNAEASSTQAEEEQTEANAEVTDFDIVTVAKNETLFKIAQRVYGSGKRYLELFEANKDILESPDLIRVGQSLKVPR